MAGNRFGTWKKRIAAVFMAVCLLGAMPGAVWAADIADGLESSISDSETKKQELEQKNAELSQALEEAKQNAEDQEALHQAYQDKIDVLDQQIEEAYAQVSQLDEEINDLQSQISNREDSIEKNTELLKERIRAIYMAGETSTLDIILGATDFNDFLDKASLLKTISDHDTKLIETLPAETSKLAQEKKTYDQKKEELTQQLDDLNAKNDELTQLSEESGIKLSQYQQEQQEAIQGLDNNSAELQQLNSDIEAYYEALRQEYENQQQASSPASRMLLPAAGVQIRPPAVTAEAAEAETLLRLLPSLTRIRPRIPLPAALMAIPGPPLASIGFHPPGMRTVIPTTTELSTSRAREFMERRSTRLKAAPSAPSGTITAAGAAATAPTA